uniref:Alpha/beta hydrolase fold-3 domain-containing protein n=1 Tax=Cucumis melo TaxID=3656 RepID=A0A9I9EF80_CUCME
MGSLPHIVEDCMGVLQLYSDGTVSRSDNIHFPFPITLDTSVVFRDVLYDASHALHLRLYKPPSSSSSSSSSPTTNKKLPILFFFHGGGFCVGSRSWPNSHNCCVRLALGLDALVIAPDYRLAPEHRLPAAVEDGVKAIEWVRKAGKLDEWIEESGDLKRVFVMGDSSGGNIAHHLAVRIGIENEKFGVRGFVLMAPFFGGVRRTKSEEGPAEQLFDLEALDRLKLSFSKFKSKNDGLDRKKIRLITYYKLITNYEEIPKLDLVALDLT